MSARASRNTGMGIDIGGTGIKGALVDLKKGDLASDRIRIPTPKESTTENVAKVVAQIVEKAGFSGEVGITFPAVMQHGIARTAANIDESWIGTDVGAAMESELGMPVEVLNDADAAGLAEVRYGAGKDVQGVVLLLTFGTGIGSALFIDGVLVPNTEFGHIELDGADAEEYAAGSVKDKKGMTHKKWAKRVDKYLAVLEKGLWPDLIIVGGGISKKADKWVPHLTNRTPIAVAKLINNAGIVGAALAAKENIGQ